MFNKLLAVALVFCAVLALAACGGDGITVAATSAPPDAGAPVTPSASTPDSPPAAEGEFDVEALAGILADVAGLGDNRIKSMELDLKAGGVDLADVAAFAGYESQTYSDNGGLVLVVQAVPGAADAVARGLESFKTSRMDDRYAEFATQLENTANARIRTSGDLVVLAVSATGHDGGWEQLDAALDAEGFK
jgi:hypothetical protein